jgi:hypothetical protein
MYNSKIVLPERDPLSPQGYARDDVSVEELSLDSRNKKQVKRLITTTVIH